MSPKVLVSEIETKIVAYRLAAYGIVLQKLGGIIEEMEIPNYKSSRKCFPEKIKAKLNNHGFISKERCHRCLCLSVTRRVAEEIAFGKDGITDISAKEVESAANFARKMVFELGMSEALGSRAIVPIDLSKASTETKRMVEKDISIFLERAFEKAHEIIEAHKDTFEKLAQTLIERRKLGQDEIKAILEGQDLPKQMTEDETKKNAKSKSTFFAYFAKLKSLVSKL